MSNLRIPRLLDVTSCMQRGEKGCQFNNIPCKGGTNLGEDNDRPIDLLENRFQFANFALIPRSGRLTGLCDHLERCCPLPSEESLRWRLGFFGRLRVRGHIVVLLSLCRVFSPCRRRSRI